ncbi:MAG TPA: hypothetical protein VFD89_03185, partial [Clostridia bacterium]|nr:hypothetical protein [Clostridia bacterium]
YYCGHRLKKDDKSILGVRGDGADIHNQTTKPEEPTKPVEHEITIEEPCTEAPANDKHNHDYSNLFGDNDLFRASDAFTGGSMPEIDLGTQIPLRRYQKDKRQAGSGRLLKVVFPVLTLILGLLAVFYWMSQTGRRFPGTNNLPQTIAVSTSVEQITKDDEKAYRIVFNTVNGKEISFLNDIKAVENGRAEFIIDEAGLYGYSPQLDEEGSYQVYLDATVSAPNLPETMERVSIALSEPYNYAPFTLLMPSSSETEFQGDSSKVSFRIQPDSNVLINGEDFSETVSKDGRFEMEFHLPPKQDELVLDIRVSTPGYLDNIQQIILRRAHLDVTLSINETSPILSDEQWVKITGVIHPEASLETDVEIFEEPDIDSSTGAFSAYIKADRPGYTPCTLTAKLGDKESSIEIIVDRKTTVDAYTSTAWKPDYIKLQQDDQLNNGRHFVFSGNVVEIIESGHKNVFTVSEPQSDRLYHVEFWGSFDFNPGEEIRVFGNRWGNKEGLPRFLAKYIYR